MLLDIQPGRLFSDHALAQYLDSGTVPEPEVVQVLFRALKPGTCAVDAGANVGFFTVLMSKLVGSEGFVIAIEPDKRNIDVLMKNLDINDCKNVEIVTAPLAAKVEQTMFYECGENGQSSRFNAAALAKITALETTTLTNIIGTRQPTLLKLDVEGAETEAILGCEYRFPYVISEVNTAALQRADSSPEELIENIGLWGHTPHVLHFDGSLPSAVSSAQKIKPTRENANVLFTTRNKLVDLWPEVEI
jgi:FkbM family methyltransferase